MKNLMILFSTLLLSFILAAQNPYVLAPDALQGPTPVLRVVDGDTITLTINGIEENARLIGIDTPETKHPTRGVEPYGPEASAFTKELLQGKQVWIEFDVEERDRYRRPLVYVYFEDDQGTCGTGTSA
jgi:endonuclease YncB( thermonuclease family)